MNENEAELFKAIRTGSILPERSREYWDQNEREEVTTLYGSGMGISRIALHLQRSEMAIIQQLLTMELLTSPRTTRNRIAKVPQCLCQKCEFKKECTHQTVPQEDCYVRTL